MNPIPVILGPTASGKSTVALAVAQSANLEIISVDSMKVYRHMDIGTAKPSEDSRKKIPHHFIDIRNPDELYSTADFFRDCCGLIEQSPQKPGSFLLEGGTALYFRALFQGLFEGPDADWEIRSALEEQAEQSEDPQFLHKQLQSVDPETATKLHPNDRKRNNYPD